MKSIKGLMLKDMLIFKFYKKNYIFSFITFIILIFITSFYRNMIITGTVLLLLMFGMNSISTFSFDENSDSNKYLLSLPINRKEMVISKYLFAFLTSFITLIIGLFTTTLLTILATKKLPIIDNFNYIYIIFTAVTLLICSDIPCIYKWGVEKGRMQSIIVPIFVIIILGSILLFLMLIFPNLYTFITSNLFYKYIPLIAIILNIIFYYVSYLISCKIFNNTDL